MGSFLDTYFESEYVNISITFEKGRYSAHSKDNNRVHNSQLNPPESNETLRTVSRMLPVERILDKFSYHALKVVVLVYCIFVATFHMGKRRY